MSGSSGSGDCPRCGGKDTLMISSDWKPYNQEDGTCVECGFSYYTQAELLSLQDTNGERDNCGLEPLETLKEPLPEWVSNGHEPRPHAVLGTFGIEFVQEETNGR